MRKLGAVTSGLLLALFAFQPAIVRMRFRAFIPQGFKKEKKESIGKSVSAAVIKKPLQTAFFVCFIFLLWYTLYYAAKKHFHAPEIERLSTFRRRPLPMTHIRVHAWI